ncbi:MAG: hypothetical protein KatS3mg023_2624 [Armatimonadota bacterium]|nr:MAG: hypothetical protein KatS3mg023_2624 [Armatimonadota bacterium]
MRRLWSLVTLACLTAGLLGLAVSTQADLQLKLLRSFNLSTIFNGTDQGCGDGAIDAAFDGTTVYVAGFRSQSGVGPVGIVRIDNVLNLPSGNLGYGSGVAKIFGWNAPGVGRDTRLFYYGGYLYVGFGLGHNTNPDTAIVRLTPNGIWDEFWSNDGIVSLSELGVGRYDTIALDPGYGGSGPALAVGTLHLTNPQAIRRVSLSSGALIGTTNTVAPNYLRDIAFAPNGDIYMYRASGDANDGIFKAVRTGVNSFAEPVRLIPFDSGNYQEHRIVYVPASLANQSLPDLLVRNFRFSPQDPASRKIYISDTNGNPLLDWDGSGVTEDGVEVGAFGDTIIGASYYLTGDGKVLLFVVGGQTSGSPAGTIDRLSILELVTTAKVSGTVTLGDYDGDAGQVPVTIEIRNPGETTPVETHVVNLDSTGAYEFSTALTGTYDVAAKASHWLRQVIPGVNLTGAPVTLNFSLINGDVDGDNEVTLFDFGQLVTAFGAMPGDSNWNPNADLDGDEEVSLFDFGILVRNFGMVGDE